MNNSTLVNAKIEKKGWPGSEQSLLVFHLIKYQLFRYTLKKKKKTNKQTKQNKAKTKKKRKDREKRKKDSNLVPSVPRDFTLPLHHWQRMIR